MMAKKTTKKAPVRRRKPHVDKLAAAERRAAKRSRFKALKERHPNEPPQEPEPKP